MKNPLPEKSFTYVKECEKGKALYFEIIFIILRLRLEFLG